MDSWKQFCGAPLVIWDGWSFGRCFRRLAILCPTHALLAVVCAFYMGSAKTHFCRLSHQMVIIFIRMAVSIALMLCPLVCLLFCKFFSHDNIYFVDYIYTFLTAFTWLMHTGYLCTLKSKLTSHTRGPMPVLFCWLLTLIASILVLRAKIYDSSLNKQVLIEKYIAGCTVGLHVIYCLTLLPRGEAAAWHYEELSNINSEINEREPLMSASVTSYGGFHEERDPYTLGVAEEDCGFISKLIFWWVRPLMIKGSKNLLQNTDDLYDLTPALRASTIDSRFSSCMQSFSMSNSAASSTESEASDGVVRKPGLSLLQAFHKCYGFEYYAIGLLKLLTDALGFLGPILLNFLVQFLENENEPLSHGYYYAVALCLITFIGALCNIQFSYLVARVGLKVRASLVTTVYRKTLSVNKNTLTTFSCGEIMNFMSTDCDRIVNFCQSFHMFWSLPLQIAVTLYLLYQQVKLAFLAGIIFAVMLIPLNQKIAIKIGELSKSMMEQKDKRIKLMNEVLIGISVIKMHAWENVFFDKIQNLRKLELKLLKGRKYLDAFCVFFWATTPVIISLLTFTTFTLMGNQLTAAKVFTSLALFNMLITPLNAFPWVINGIIEAWVSLQRVQTFLDLPSLHPEEYYSEERGRSSKVNISDGVFCWKRSNVDNSLSRSCASSRSSSMDFDSERQSFVLGPIDLNVTEKKLIGIIGKVGSGKSTLLASILADLHCQQGKISLPRADRQHGIGFLPQEPWIQHATVQENIIFGKTLNSTKYHNVIEACSLLDDLKVFPAGDKSEVGERGITLSGGQRARIALARAVYQDLDIYLLDDPFSAVDVHVAEHIFSHCILGLLKNKTRILCTHHVRFLRKADHIIVLDSGKIVAQGSPETVLQTHYNEIFPNILEDPYSSQTSDDEPKDEENDTSTSFSESEGQLVEEEERVAGNVKFHVYKSYWKAVGNTLATSILLACLLMQASRTLSDWWLSYWVSQISEDKDYPNPENHSDIFLNFKYLFPADNSTTDVTHSNDSLTFYLAVYGSLGAANSIFTLLRAFLYAYGGICAAIVIHTKLLSCIFKAPAGFFDVTPLGRILNRFSSDIFNIDDTLPFVLNILLAQVYSLIGSLAITCYGLPWIIPLLLPLGAIYYSVQKYYRCTSRELKRLCSVTLSPIYAHFSETLSGHSTIRALASVVRFRRQNSEKLDNNQQATFATLVASQWLSLRLQMIGVAIITGVGFLAVLEYHFDTVDPGLVGLALSYALSVTNLLNGVVTYFTETEKEMVSVERAVQYIEGVGSETREGIILPPFAWPMHGVITFKNVSLQYRPLLPLALKNVSFETSPAEKLGIIGRTGSGKSSLFQVLFRMVELKSGEIFMDGVNLAHLSLIDLRSNMAVIPQSPFLFSGTVRENVDPLSCHSDGEVWKAIKQCQLDPEIKRIGGLTAEIGERGQRLSAGQRQLLCLARALLSKARVLCIDEATACVDEETDLLIQKTIRSVFRYATILTIAHRIKTVLDSDRVLVMEAGRIVELDTPSYLINDPQSYFYGMVSSSML